MAASPEAVSTGTIYPSGRTRNSDTTHFIPLKTFDRQLSVGRSRSVMV